MNDFNRDYERDYDHLDEFPEPERNDLTHNKKVKAVIAMVFVLAVSILVYMDIIGLIGKWGQ